LRKAQLIFYYRREAGSRKRSASDRMTKPLGPVPFLPHVSVDCVIFGFRDGALKVLLLKWKQVHLWVLPGGMIGVRESLDRAASRVLQERAGLRRVHMRQFYAFGGMDRREAASLKKLLPNLRLRAPKGAAPVHRVVSIGYYALVDYEKVTPRLDHLSDAFSWFPVDDLPPLAFDHRAIVRQARIALRASLDSPTTGATLLPPKFTMPELQRLHEAILGKPLDRRNFQKRMLERGGIERLDERRVGAPHRSPYLYRFVPRAAQE
jgi:ADP-ribose pyrophosphatase YjhB (NUDIX family)